MPKIGKMITSQVNWLDALLLSCAAIVVLYACGLAQITLVSQDYRTTLAIAGTLSLMGFAFAAIVFARCDRPLFRLIALAVIGLSAITMCEVLPRIAAG